jgi:8-oxo-dGTP pyrophosphatase MutT (NUDIX family)
MHLTVPTELIAAENLINEYTCSSSGERAIKNRFLALIGNYPGCLYRHNVPGHLTASAWIVDKTGDFALFTLHKKLNLWLQLGGHADGQGNLLQVAQREATEESGLEVVPYASTIFDLDIHEIPAYGTEPAHEHYDVRFIFKADKSEQLTISPESKDLRWFRLTEVNSNQFDDSVCRMRDKWLSLR